MKARKEIKCIFCDRVMKLFKHKWEGNIIHFCDCGTTAYTKKEGTGFIRMVKINWKKKRYHYDKKKNILTVCGGSKRNPWTFADVKKCLKSVED